jgi:hypothetical protein
MPATTDVTVLSIKELLDRSDKAVEEAVLRIYDRQTNGEQAARVTSEHNGVGFSAFDADILSSFAEWMRRSTRPVGQRLTARQLQVARKRIKRYAKQLVEIAQAKAARSAA